jgi:hypothetical protein
MGDLYAAIVAAAIVLGVWLALAAPIAWLVHLRMRRVEETTGAPALPRYETPLLLMGVAAIALPVSFFVALVGCIVARWSRLGRNATLVFLGQMTATVLAAIGAAIRSALVPPESPLRELVPLVFLACAMLGAGVLAATVVVWTWAGRRAARLRAGPPTGEAPGVWRFLLYAASAFFWPLGIVLVIFFAQPENASAGAISFRCSLVNMAGIALGTCVGVSVLANVYLM